MDDNHCNNPKCPGCKCDEGKRIIVVDKDAIQAPGQIAKESLSILKRIKHQKRVK